MPYSKFEMKMRSIKQERVMQALNYLRELEAVEAEANDPNEGGMCAVLIEQAQEEFEQRSREAVEFDKYLAQV